MEQTDHLDILRTVVAASPVSIVSVDADGNVMSWNTASEQLFGWREEEVLGRPLPVIPLDRRDEATSVRRQTMEGRSLRDVEVVRQRRDGSLIPLSLSTAPLYDIHGTVIGTMVVYVDLTQRRVVEEELRRDQTRQQAVIATQHEIATADLDLVTAMQIVAERTCEIVAADAVGVGIVDGDELHFPAFTPRDMVGSRLKIDASFSGWSVLSERPVLSNDLDTGPRVDRAVVKLLGAKAALAAPIRRAGTVVGVVAVGASRINAFDTEDLEVVQLFAGLLSAAMSQDAERRAEEYLTKQARALREQAELLHLAHDAIFVRDLDTAAIRFWNRGAERMYGFSAEEALGVPSHVLLETVFPQPLPEIERTVRESGFWEGELRHTSRDGTTIAVASRWALQRNDGGEPVGILEINSDITERKQAEETLATLLAERTATLEIVEHRALHDALTDLPNRTLLRDRLGYAIQVARRDHSPFLLLFMDLDRFKHVNDTLGHRVGDILLQEVARRLQGVLRESDTVARLGGDEFAILLPGADLAGARHIVPKILEALRPPFTVEHYRLNVDGSIGIALYPAHGETADVLMQRADVAMYVAKRDQTGAAVYSEDQDPNTRSRLTLMAELRQAIEHDELVLHYQPKLELQTGKVVGVEALVRWLHPTRGLIPPDEFITLAEQTGFMRPLTRWVLEAALRQCHNWLHEGTDLRVAVNLSALNLHDETLPREVAEALDAAGVRPEEFEVEITESAVMQMPERARTVLNQLTELGVRISIDDFGVGQSSLAYLAQLPVDEIKIDKSFLIAPALNGTRRVIVRSIVDLGHGLGCQVLAEGVEDQATLDMLREMDCDLVQGYHISRPLPAEDFSAWLKRWSSPHAT